MLIDLRPSNRLVYVVTLVVAAAWVLLDQATKMAAVRAFGDGMSLDLGPVVLRLIYNEGGAFSLPIQLPWLFVGVTVIVCVLVARALPDTDSLGLAAAYGLVVGGAIGNGADRIFRDGAVVDMIDLDFWPLQGFPVFNVADIGITVGAALVAILMVLADRRETAASQAVLEDDDEDGTATARSGESGDDAPAAPDVSHAIRPEESAEA
ncbi:signal peptidase II [soil metagenome]